MLFFFITVLVLLIIKFLQSPAFKVLIGESPISQEIYKNLDKNEYRLIKDITLPALGDKTQIEHVIVSRYGLFVIESKYMKGWVYGGERRKEWTQSLPGSKFTFQNPLHQNFRNIRSLAHLLHLTDDKFYSIVVFTGKSTFKSVMPENVMNNNYLDYIKSKDTEIFSNAEVESFVEKIKLFKAEGLRSTNRKQVAYLRQPYRT